MRCARCGYRDTDRVLSSTFCTAGDGRQQVVRWGPGDWRARAAETAGPGRSSLLPMEWNRGVPSQAQLCVAMGAVAVGGALLAV